MGRLFQTLEDLYYLCICARMYVCMHICMHAINRNFCKIVVSGAQHAGHESSTDEGKAEVHAGARIISAE